MQFLGVIFAQVLAWTGLAIVRAIAVSLGIGLVTYVGLDSLLTWAQSYAQSQLGGLSADMLSLVALMKVPNAISMIFSAITTRITLTTITGSLTFLRMGSV